MSVSVFGKITVIKRNGSSGSQYPVTNNHCTFGRDADCEIRIQLPTVSDKECELRTDENGNFILTKVNQEGEILVNGKNVDSDATINHNDVLTIAGRSFRFEYPPSLMSVDISEEKMKNMATPKNSVLQRVKQTGSRRVSFGPQLSPEQFAAFMPPNTPVKKGAIPTFEGTPKEIKRRRSVLKEAKGTPIAEVKNNKRKSVGKKPSPKIIKKQDALNTKGENQCSFDDLVALVGLDNNPKSGKSTPARKSNGSIATPVQSNAKTPVHIKTSSKKAHNEDVPEDEIVLLMNDPLIPTGQTMKSGKKVITLDSADVDERYRSPQMFGTPTKKRRSSVKISTIVTTMDEILEDTLPYEVEAVQKANSGKQSRCSSVKIATPKIMERVAETVTITQDVVQESTTPIGKRKSLKSGTPKSSNLTPKSEETGKDATMDMNDITLDDTVPYIDSSIENKKTPNMKRKSLNKKTPKTSGSTLKPKNTPGQDTDVAVDIQDEIASDDTVPYMDSPVEKSKTPSMKRQSLKTPKSTGITPKSKETTAEANDVAMDNLDDTVPYIDSSVEKNKTPSMKRRSLKTPKSSGVTPKTKETTERGNDAIMEILDDTVPYTDSPVEKTKTPKMNRKSLKSPKTSDETPKFEETSGQDDAVPHVDSPIEKSKTPSMKKKSLNMPKSSDSASNSKEIEGDISTNLDITNSAMDDTVPDIDSPVLKSKSPALKRRSLKSMTPKSAVSTPKFEENAAVEQFSDGVLDATVPLIRNVTPSNLKRKSLKNSIQKPMIDTPRPNTKVVQNTNTTSALDDTVPYIDSPIKTNVSLQEKRKSSRIVSPKVAEVINDTLPVSHTEDSIEDTKEATEMEDVKIKGRKSMNVATPRTVDNTEVVVTSTIKNRKSIGKTPRSALKNAKIDDVQGENNVVTPKVKPVKTPKSSAKKTPNIVLENAIKTPKSTVDKKLSVKGDEDLTANVGATRTPKSAVKNLSDGDTKKKTPAKINADKIIGKNASAVKSQSRVEKATPFGGRKSLGKGATPKMSTKKTPKQNESDVGPTPTRSINGADNAKSNAKKTPSNKKETSPKSKTLISENAGIEDKKVEPTLVRSEKRGITPKSTSKRGAGNQVLEEPDDLDSSYQELRITKKRETPARKGVEKILTPKSNAKIAPERKSIARKTPRRSVGTGFLSRKSITKSSKRQSLRIKRKSGVLLWSEIVRKNTDKQPETKNTAVLMRMKPLKRGRRSIAKTPKQLREMRHIDSPATIYIGRRTRMTEDLDSTPLDFDMSTDYSSEESFINESVVSVEEEKVVNQVQKPSRKPKVKGQEVKDHFGTKRLLKTPREKKITKPVTEKFGTKRIFKTPKDAKKNEPVEEKLGTKRLFTTPKERSNNKPVNDDFGTKRLLRTPHEVRSKSIDGDYCIDLLHGEEEVAETAPPSGKPKKRVKNQPVAEHFGTKRLLQTPKDKVRSKSIDGDYHINLLHGAEEDLEKAPSGGEHKKRVKNQPVEKDFGTKRLLKTPRDKVRHKSIDGDFCIDTLYPSEEGDESAPSGGEMSTAPEIVPKKQTTREKQDEGEVESALSSGEITTANEESAESEIVQETEARKPIRRATRNKKVAAPTSKAAIGEEEKDDQTGIAPAKRSTRKRKPPANLDENVVTMAKKKVKSDAVPVEAEIAAKNDEEVTKRSSRARKDKDTASTQKKNIGNTENLLVENSEISSVITEKPKRSTRKAVNSKVTTEALPTKRSTRSKVVKQTLDVIAEQDEAKDLDSKIEATEKETKMPTRGRSKKNTGVKDSSDVEAKMPTSTEMTKKTSRTTRRGKLTTIVEETSITTEKTAKKVSFEAVEVVTTSTTRHTRGRKATSSKVTTKSDEEVIEPTKKQTRSKAAHETGNKKEVDAPVQKRSIRARKPSDEDAAIPESKTVTLVTKRSVRARKASKDEIPKESTVSEPETVEPAPKRSNRARKSSKEESKKEEKTTENVISESEIAAPASKRSMRTGKPPRKEKNIANVASETETTSLPTKRSTCTRKPPKEDVVDVKKPAKVRKTTSEVENVTQVVEPVAKRASRGRKPSKDEPVDTTTERKSTKTTRTQKVAMEAISKSDESVIAAKTTRKRKTPASKDIDIQNAPKRRNHGNVVVEKNEVVVENVPKRSSRAKKTTVNKVEDAAPVPKVTKSKAASSNKEVVPVRKSARSTRRAVKA